MTICLLVLANLPLSNQPILMFDTQREHPSLMDLAKSQISRSASEKEKALLLQMIEHGMKPYYAKYLINFFRINEINLDNIKGDIHSKDIQFYMAFRLRVYSRFELQEMNRAKKFTPEEKAYLYETIGWDFDNAFVTCSYGNSITTTRSDLFGKHIHYIIFNEKYKVLNDIGLDDQRKFLQKHHITWGNMESLDRFLKQYNQVLDNYRKRQ